ncbi:MAG: carbamoyl phosphate synthase small subunit [Candidatus Altiarchaeales archaeon IMC4]|nr:MAG: carbamoyl phosphate synthase small subunit [Candidatus Altiarchaeales archaeon IMC4]
MAKAAVILSDGTVVEGDGFGGEATGEGEVVFNTSMTGYQEVLTDPSYTYQILMMTYPLIGNYGINDDDFESDKIHAEGFVVRETCLAPSHRKSVKTLDAFLKDYGVPGISGLDTRFLTKKIRMHGVMNGILANPYEPKDLDELKARAIKLKSISGLDLIGRVTTKKVKRYDIGSKKTVVMLDCGEKASIIKSMNARGVNVIKVPADYSVEEIMEHSPFGIVISNGPGDPHSAKGLIKTVSKLADESLPMFGICMGHQIISLACGGEIYKLKFGHRGSNHPVQDTKTGKVYITAQNHGFAMDAESAKDANLEVSHINLNDKSVEGVRHKELPIRGVQYHPEANPGPWDNYYLFDEFIEMMK